MYLLAMGLQGACELLAMKIYLLAIGLQGACKLLAMRRYLLPATFYVFPGKLFSKTDDATPANSSV